MNYEIAKELYNLAMNEMKNNLDWVNTTISILYKNGYNKFADTISKKYS